jgi:hypothetical protein
MARPSLRQLGSPEGEQEEGLDMRISVLGVDLRKNVYSIAGLDGSGAVVLRRRAKRETLIALGRGFRLAWWRWRPAAAPIILTACSPLRVTTCG